MSYINSELMRGHQAKELVSFVELKYGGEGPALYVNGGRYQDLDSSKQFSAMEFDLLLTQIIEKISEVPGLIWSYVGGDDTNAQFLLADFRDPAVTDTLVVSLIDMEVEGHKLGIQYHIDALAFVQASYPEWRDSLIGVAVSRQEESSVATVSVLRRKPEVEG